MAIWIYVLHTKKHSLRFLAIPRRTCLYTALGGVEPRGFEPLTSSMPLRRSTN